MAAPSTPQNTLPTAPAPTQDIPEDPPIIDFMGYSFNQSDQQYYLQLLAQSMQEGMNNCLFRATFSGLAGAGAGLAIGLFLSSAAGPTFTPGMGYQNPLYDLPWRTGLKVTWRQMTAQMKSYAKSFGTFGFVYLGTECLISKYRGEHDLLNSIYAGCSAGAIMAHGGGIQTMVPGCIGFAAFSLAIDWYMKFKQDPPDLPPKQYPPKVRHITQIPPDSDLDKEIENPLDKVAPV